MKQVRNYRKASEKVYRNDQIITACHINVYLHKMIMNE